MFITKPNNSDDRAWHHAANDRGSGICPVINPVVIGRGERCKKHYGNACCQHHWIFLGCIHEAFPSAMNRRVKNLFLGRQLRRQGNALDQFVWAAKAKRLLAMRTVNALAKAVAWKLNQAIAMRALRPAISQIGIGFFTIRTKFFKLLRSSRTIKPRLLGFWKIFNTFLNCITSLSFCDAFIPSATKKRKFPLLLFGGGIVAPIFTHGKTMRRYVSKLNSNRTSKKLPIGTAWAKWRRELPQQNHRVGKIVFATHSARRRHFHFPRATGTRLVRLRLAGGLASEIQGRGRRHTRGGRTRMDFDGRQLKTLGESGK